MLRAFTESDVEQLVELDADPRVVNHVTGGRATPRPEVEAEVLPAFLRHDPSAPDQGLFGGRGPRDARSPRLVPR